MELLDFLKKDRLLLQQAIRIYNRRVDKKFLISYKTNKNHLAKVLRIASTENAPEATIFALDKNASDKIFLVLSKSDDSEIYDAIECSISKEHAGELC